MEEKAEENLITKEYLKKLIKREFKTYYSIPYLNDILYLHYKGFGRIENLEEFTGLKTIYLEGNCLKKIEGLDQLVHLKCLYLQENLITKIEGLDNLTELIIVNLNNNQIKRIEKQKTSLENCQRLQTLELKHNKIKEVEGLFTLAELSVVDLSHNQISEDNTISQLQKISNLSVLYLQNNPLNREIKSYRKQVIFCLEKLKYLDDRPVFDDERRCVKAFMQGGIEAEKLERETIKEEKRNALNQEHASFMQMMRGYENSEGQLSTYNTSSQDPSSLEQSSQEGQSNGISRQHSEMDEELEHDLDELD